MTEESKSPTLRAALIGLLGTVLTVCGGLGGAIVTSAATIYQVQKQNQKLDLTAPDGGKTLRVDTGSIFITRQEAAGLDSETYYVNLEQAFILHRPLPGWGSLEEMTVEEQLAETHSPCQAVCNQPVYRIRFGEPLEVESDRETTINGQLLPDEILNLSEQLYGPPPWKLPTYSQMILNIFEKAEVESLGIHNLPDMVLLMTRYSTGRVNRMVAQEGSHFAIVQQSNTYARVRVNGADATMNIDDWLLFAEADNAFYIIEIAYTPQSGQSVQVWDDLQTYINQFRVVQ